MMDRPVIVIGAGGHAKVVIDALIKQSTDIVGIVDSDGKKGGRQILGIDIIGDDATVLRYSKDEIYLVNGIGSVGTTKLREKIFMKFKSQGYRFPAVVHPSAVIANDVEILEGAQVMAGVVIQTGAVIGQNTIVNTKASIDHDCTIQSHVHISPGVTICGGVLVGEGTHVGAGTTVIQGVEIGANAIVGAGSLVLKNVADNTKIYGSPVKEVKI
jgi:sugar O-acyltransferase (sialic acid O-acetyltransferase NeuD family)